MEKSKSKLKSIRLREEVVMKVEKMAERENRSFTNMVETILLNTPENWNLDLTTLDLTDKPTAEKKLKELENGKEK